MLIGGDIDLVHINFAGPRQIKKGCLHEYDVPYDQGLTTNYARERDQNIPEWRVYFDEWICRDQCEYSKEHEQKGAERGDRIQEHCLGGHTLVFHRV